ncbi:Ig-like domain-containing protein [Microbacterium sp. ZW T5_45]|uniref:Ig-like domain-containing protein n=1 Tax=Microbacterium sp. ZW T5_45 TaxID=3378080 RepID=UPI0038550E39
MLFAWDGVPLGSLRTFEYVYTGAIAPREVLKIERVDLSVADGAAITLPATIAVTYDDGSIEHPPVVWSDVVEWIRGPGVYPVQGRTSSGLSVTASVTVLAANLVQNGSFESSDMSAWTLTGPATRSQTADGSDGEHALTFWDGQAYATSASQTVSGVPAGTYMVQATTQGSRSNDSRVLSATTSVGSWNAPLEFTVWNEMHTATLPAVVVGADGIVELRADFALSAGAWGVLDDLRLVAVPTPEPTDTASLSAALARAADVARDRYTDDSLDDLDYAVSVGKIVLAGSTATGNDVKHATKLVEKAVKKLRGAEG